MFYITELETLGDCVQIVSFLHLFSHLKVYRERERERDRSIPNISELTTRTVTMSRDQQDGHGFGICVKAGKDPGQYIKSVHKRVYCT